MLVGFEEEARDRVRHHRLLAAVRYRQEDGAHGEERGYDHSAAAVSQSIPPGDGAYFMRVPDKWMIVNSNSQQSSTQHQ